MRNFSSCLFLLRIFFSALISSFIGTLSAQTPTITSFTPTSGPIGTVVTITGTNFNTTAADNIVWFGAVKASVSAASTTELTVTVPTGETYKPISVTVDGNTAFSGRPFNVTFPSTHIIDAQAFASYFFFGTSPGPWDLTEGDLDGDGKPDVILIKSPNNILTVYRNTSISGYITASSLAASFDITTGSNPICADIGDLDGDGKLDLVVTNNSDGTISIFRNSSTSGSITFDTRVDITIGSNPYDVKIGDIDGDGKPDIVVTNNGNNTVSVLKNTSTPGSITSGSFATKVDFTTGANPSRVAISDIDGDGKPELIVNNLDDNTVSIFRNTSTPGSITSGSFASSIDFVTGSRPYGVVIGDLDGDGKPDLAVTNNGSNTVSVFRNTSTPGSITSGSLASKVDFTTGNEPYGFSIGDIDGDGRPDLAVACYNGGISVLRNTSMSGSITNNSFAAKVDFGATPGPANAIIGDFDGDGKPDLFVSTNVWAYLDVILNTLSKPVPPVITSFTPTSGPVGTEVTITGTNFSTTLTDNIVWFGAVQANVTAATSMQLTVTVPAGATFQPISVTVKGYTALSVAPFIVTFPGIRPLDASAFTSAINFTTGVYPWNIAIGDIDGDGKPDLAVANVNSNSVSVYRNTGSSDYITSGSFSEKVDFTTGATPHGVKMCDIDGDGKLDLIVLSSNIVSVFRNTSSTGSVSTSSFETRVDLPAGSGSMNIAFSDIDGDGKPDIIIQNSTGFSVYRNRSTTGSIVEGSFESRVDFSTGTNPYDIAVADIDGDGKPDIAVTKNTDNTVSVFRNTSTSGFINSGSFAAKVDFTTGSGPRGVIFGDIDGDGKPDMIVVNNNDQSVSVLRNTSVLGTINSGSFADKIDFATGTSPNCVAIGDIDGDGKPDLTITDYGSSTVSVLKNTSVSGAITSGSFTSKVDLNAGSGPDGITVADLNGDGEPELVIANTGSNTVSVIQNRISEPYPPLITSFSPTSGPIGTTVIITGTHFNTTPANNIVWFGAVQAPVTAATSTSLSVIVPTGATFQPITVTVNGIITYAGAPFNVTFPSTRIIDASGFISKVDLTAGNVPLGVATGDIDGDGKPDLVVVNSSGNFISVYRNISSSGSITAGSFAARVDFITGSAPYLVVIADIDGDGKLDLVVTNSGSGNISVLRNTSTLGSITSASFSARIDFSTGYDPVGIAVGDIDGDGKPDLAVTNGGNTIAILRNTSTPGSITTGSFTTSIISSFGPVGVAIGDIDGDGKQDLIVSNYYGNSVSIYRNISTPGSITEDSFSTKVDFVSGSLPLYIAIGDLDGDGKPDLAVSNQNSNTVSIFRNRSISGSITTSSFDTRVDFTFNVPESIAIGDIDGDSKPDLVVSNGGNMVSVFRNVSISGSITAGSFMTQVDFPTGTGSPSPNSVAVCDMDGDGKPDIIVSNRSDNTVSLLRNTMSAPVPPVITAFTPASGPIGTTVTINGLNFNPTAANNIIWFGAVQATVTAATATQLTVIVPTGATYQPISVTTTLNGLTGYSNEPFIVTFPSTRIIEATSFSAKVDYNSGTTPVSSAISDIDGDGKPDLVVANNNSNTVSVYRNTSSSGFITAGSFATRVDFTTGTNPNRVVVGDIDGDGKPDLVVVNQNSNSISVFRNTSTPGSITASSFATKVDFATGDYPYYIAIGDIDGDGKPDLAVTNFDDNTVSVFRNTSTSGSIVLDSFTAKADFIVGDHPSGVALGDIDGDGKPDLVVNVISSNTISILRNISTSGSINTSSFATQIDITSGPGLSDLAIGDVDGDGKPDIAVTNSSGNFISVYRNISTSGSITTGSFSNKVDFSIDDTPSHISFGDIDGDGKPDLAVVNSSGVSILRNNGSSSSITTDSFAPSFHFFIIGCVYGISLCDLDGDGKLDIIYPNGCNNTVSVLRNTISAPVPPVITSFTPTSGPIGTAVTITGSNFSTTAANNIVWFGAVQATVITATEIQLTVTVPTGATYQPISVTVTGNTAYSNAPFNITFTSTHIIDPSAVAPAINFTTGSNPQSVAISDIDGDGKPDLVITNFNSNTVSVFRNTSTSGSISPGSFAAKVDFITGTNPWGVAIGDIDGDGKPDLVVTDVNSNTVSVFRNTSTSGSITGSSFAARVDFTTGTNPYGIAIGDIDGDGKPDLVVANNISNTISIFRNCSTSGSITTGSFAAKVDIPTGTNPIGVAIGDIDGDSKLDIVSANCSSCTVSVFRNISTAGSISVSSFASSVDFITGTGSQPVNVAISDIDGDGKPDLAVTNYNNWTVSIFRNTSTSGSIGAGSFDARVDLMPGIGYTPVGISIGDIDGDGKPDLVLANYDRNYISVYKNTSTSGFIGAESFAKFDIITASSSYGAAIGDIDGDGKPDIVVTNSNNNTVSVFRNTISATLPPIITSYAPTSGPIGTTVTITGSNFSTTASDNIVWFGAVKATVIAATSSTLSVTVPTGSTYNPITVTFNGLTAYSSMPFNVTFPSSRIIDATAFASKVDFTVGWSTYPNPRSVAICDLDSDGKPDIAVANSGNPSVSIFRNTSSSGSITSGSFDAKVDLLMYGSEPSGVAMGDIDGDGKPDLVVTNYSSNKVSVFRNTSTTGSITSGSFDARVDFTTGSGASSVAIGDINGDGKPDLVVLSTSSNTISVLRNTSTPGSIGADSFADKIDFTTGTGGAYGLVVGDIDGDGKPDIAFTNYNNWAVSVLRNIGTPGYITTGSFAAKVDFATGSYPNSVAIGDLDGDGKPDLVVANNDSTVSVLRNISNPGSITTGSFAPKVDFTSGTHPEGIAIGDIDGDGKLDLTVINQGNNTVSILSNNCTSGSITSGSFGSHFDFPTGPTPWYVAIGDIDGDGKPDLAIANFSSNTVSILRNTISAPVPPVIDSFTPTSGPVGTTVKIVGSNFNAAPANNIVKFGAVQATVISATSTSLSITVPVGATNQSISITNVTFGMTAYSSDPFNVTAPPVITSFTPTSGPIGTIVTIAGSNFSTSAANNIVWFGAVQATVTAATATQLTVTVPTGATYQPITVTVNGLTDYSHTPFIVSFPSAHVIDAASFAPIVDFTTGPGPMGISVCDIDGDGKPDLTSVNLLGNTVSVFRNIAALGSIASGSFAARVDFTKGWGRGVAIGDIDGDGKPDLAVTNETSNTVSIFRNTSTTGSIDEGSFAVKVDFTTGSSPFNIAICDIDGDGKPDLVVTNYNSNTVSILRNTSSSGSITANSFEAKVDFITGTSPVGVAVGDIDNDGKPDLVVTNAASGTVSVFRNTSAPGPIGTDSFAERVDFTSGITPLDVVIGDIDGDGKPELAITNEGSSKVSVFRNTSTSGSITLDSFAARVDFTYNVPESIAIGDIDGDGKPDLVVSNGGSSVSVFRNTSILGSITAGSFAASVDFTIGTNPRGVIICDIDGDSKPDIAVANYTSGTISVLRNTISSNLPAPPVITSFTPISGPIGSIVTITGSNFSSIAANNIVKFGTFQATIATATDSLLSVIVPPGVSSQNIYVTVNGQTASSTGPFNVIILTPPVISSFAPTYGPVGTTVTINGSNFSTTPSNNIVWFGAVRANITSASSSQLIVTVPIGATYQPITITVNGLTAFSSLPFSVTFQSSHIIDTASFATKVDYSTGSNPHFTLIGDIDNDGKPDLVIINSASNSISVLRNTSASGSITGTSFSSRIDFNTGNNPYYGAIADIDGDGKLDLIVTNHNDNSISVFLNTSISGSITPGSFAARVDFTTGIGPSGIAIGDIDGDGKPDLVITNQTGNTISILRNTSTTGYISASSFAPNVEFTTGTNPSSVAIGDIDGDGKPDISIANFGSNTVSVLRNISTTGVISSGSLATKVDFNTGTGPTSIAIGDLDGDNRPDLVFTLSGSNIVSIFKNASTSGPITVTSFEARVDLIASCGLYCVSIGDIDGDGKPDLATANCGYTVSVFRNTGTSGAITTNSFASRVDFTSGTFPVNVAVGDIDGDGKPDLVVANGGSNTVSVLRNIISTPVPPVINSFTPTSGTVGTIVTINGANFSITPSNNTVWFGAVQASVTATTTSQLTVTVPAGATSQAISVTVNGLTTSSTNSFNVTLAALPVISSFTPTYGLIGTTVTISGSNFSTIPANNIVWFGAVQATVTAASSTILTVIVPAGATYQPISVTVNGLTAYSNTPFNITFASTHVIDATTFTPKIDFTSGTTPWSVAIGDIDGDGKPDLIVSNSTGGSVSVYRNISTSGSITSGSFASGVDFPTGMNPWGIAVGDIDGDGKLDIAVANYGSNTISVLRNTSISGIITAGSFATRVDISTTNSPQIVAIADLDGDDKPELVATGGSIVSVFRNTSSSGSISISSFATKVDFTTGSNAVGVAIGDIDADGKPDLVVANFQSSTVSVLKNTSTLGSITSGSFAPRIDFTTGGSPWYVVIGDIDGDGKPDLAVTNYSGNTVSVFRNITTSGSISSLSFATKVDFTTGSLPYFVAIGDIDGDGKPDLAVANGGSNSVSVLRNKGISGLITTGSFSGKVDFGTGTGPQGLAIGDIDGDGQPEIIITNRNDNTFSVLRNNISISSQIPPVITSFAPWSGPVGTSLAISGSNFSTSASNNIVWFGAVRATVTSASSSQLIVTVPAGATYQPITVTVNGLTAFSSLPFIVTIPGLHIINTTNFASKVDITSSLNPYSSAIGDIDGDGKPDLVITNIISNSGPNTVSVYRNTSTSGSLNAGSFASRVDFTTGGSAFCVALGDIDGDGKLDMIVANVHENTVSVFRNTSSSGSVSSGSFAPRVDLATGSGPWSVAVGDIDGDGKTDIVTANIGSNTLSVIRNSCTPGLITADLFTRVDFVTGTGPVIIAVGDIDGDGRPDLATTNQNSNTVSVLRNISSSGSINSNSFAAKVDFTTGNFPYGVAIGDIDGDGKQDLIVSNQNGNTVSILRNISSAGSVNSGSFAARVDFQTGTGPTGITLGDIDGDGKPDICIANRTSNNISILKNNSSPGSITTSSLSAKVDYLPGANTDRISVGDIDGDGKTDIVVTNQTNSMVSVLRGIAATYQISFDYDTVCVDKSTHLRATSDIPDAEITSYKWDFGNNGSYDATGKEIVYTKQSDNNVRLDITTASNVFSFTKQIVFHKKPVSLFAVQNPCKDSQALFTNYSSATEGTIIKYNWDFNNDGNTDSQSSGDITYIYHASGYYKPSLTVETGFGCSASFSDNIYVFDPPAIEILYSPDSVIYKDQTVIVSLKDSYDSIFWSTGNTGTDISLTNAGTYSVRVVKNGCVNSRSFHLDNGQNGNELKFESSVLTLNGDGVNEKLVIKNFESYGKCNIYIYNIRGALIYSKKDYMNDWDMKINGRLLETGGYFYVIETESGVFKGSFSILR